MKVMFMGTTPFSCVVLEQLIEDGYEVVAVVTQPDRPFGRKRVLKMSPVKEMAMAHHIPVLQPEKITTASAEVLAYEPDLIITCAYGQIVPTTILDYPKHKALNVHASLLPKYRGGAPIHWAIIRGEQQTGVTLMIMDKGMDSGAMLAKQTVEILETDTMSDVEARLMNVSKHLIHDDLPRYLHGDLAPVPQDETEVTFAYTLQKEDEYIDFNRPTIDVYNHIRGLIKWPVGYALLDQKRVKFHGVTLGARKSMAAAGTIVAMQKAGLEIATADGSVLITQIQPFGRGVMSAQDFMNGRNLVGGRFNE